MVRRAALDAAITNLQAASGAMITTPDGTVGPPLLSTASADSQPTELPRGAFLNKSLPAAVKLYLSSVVKKQTIKEIASALREGGVESTSDNFEGVITGCLHRMKSNGELLQFKDGWALAERYPAHIRASLSHGGSAPHKRAKKKGKKAAKNPKPPKPTTSASPQPAVAESATPASTDSLDQRIERFARLHPEAWVTSQEVANALPGILPKVVAMTLGRMAKKNGWEKSEDGKYRFGAT